MGGLSKIGGCSSKVRRILRRTLPLRRTSFHLRRTPPSSSIFYPTNEEPPPSSMFGADERRTSPIFNLRSSAPKIEESLLIFDLRLRRSVRRSDGRRGGDFFEDRGVLRRWGGFFDFPAPKNEESPAIFDLRSRKNEEPAPIFHLLGQNNEEHPLFSSSSDPPPPTSIHQVLSALLRFRSSARSSTLKIGPKIEIGPLLFFPRRTLASTYPGRPSRVKGVFRRIEPHPLDRRCNAINTQHNGKERYDGAIQIPATHAGLRKAEYHSFQSSGDTSGSKRTGHASWVPRPLLL